METVTDKCRPDLIQIHLKISIWFRVPTAVIILF